MPSCEPQLEAFDAAQRAALLREAHAYSAERARDALLIYAGLWALVGLTTSFPHEHPLLFGLVGALALLSGVVRWRELRRFEPLYDASPARWSRRWASSTLLTAALWGTFCALVLTVHGLDWLGTLLVLTATVLCTSFLSSHAPHLCLTRAYVIAICGPIIVAGLVARPPHGELLSLMLGLFVLYNWRQAARVHEAYWSAARNRMLLEIRAEQLERARLLAEQANRAKTRFLSNLSHELRTPLNTVLGMLAELRDGALSPAQRRASAEAGAAASDLLALIDELLDVSEIDARTLELRSEAFDPVELVYAVAEAAAARARRKGLEIVVDYDIAMPERVVGDPERMRQALSHLVGNAVKFTEHGHVLIEARCEQLDPDTAALALRVTDTGPGIPPAAREQVFERFHQLDTAPSRRHGGAGIGLALARDLTHLMGGRLEIERSDERGSCLVMHLRLPYTGRRGQSGPTPAGDLRGLHVAVADPCAATRAVIGKRLEFWGARVSSFADTDALLAAAAQHAAEGAAFDVVIWDCAQASCCTPAIASGCAAATRFAEAVRNSPWGRDTGLVMLLTPDCEPDPAVLTALELEAALRKPVRLDQLYERLAVFRARRGRSPQPGAPRPARSLRVLVAEDNPVNRRVALRMLEKLGHSCEVATDGAQAVQMALAHRYDVVLMDCQMPELDGLEATERIRQLEGEGRRTPIVAVTAHVTEHDRRQCLQSGMDGFLTKPFDAAQLENALARATAGSTANAPTETEPSSRTDLPPAAAEERG